MLQTFSESGEKCGLDPCAENSLPDWVKTTSFEDLFGKPLRNGKKDRFYRISDLLYENKERIEKALREREISLFNLEKTILLYDLTNTYFEGNCTRNPKAKRGNSKEKRFDAPLLFVGLLLDSEGFVIRHDVFDGNRHDSTNLFPMIEKLTESKKEEDKPLIILDSGFASEENLQQLRIQGFDYIVVGKRATRLARISHKHLGNLEASAFPIFSRTSLGKVYKPSQQKVAWHLEKQSA